VKVLICDDSAFMRRTLQQLIGSDPELQVVDIARNGEEGLQKAKLLRPDIMTLDIEMPVMDGLTALRKVRLECSEPPAVLMCSSLTAEGSRETLQAMRMGAADFILKQTNPGGMDAVRAELLAKLKAIGHTRRAKMGVVRTVRPAINAASATTLRSRQYELIVIGSSTGGPPVLEKLITSIPAGLRVPVVIAQHMPALFTQSLAARIGEQSKVSVRHVTGETHLEAGAVHIIQGGRHGHIRKAGAGLALSVGDEPAGLLYKPSVDELFFSAAKAAGPRCLGIVLTGMGEDGALGAAQLHAAGAALVAQEASTCVVYGMPRALVDRNLAHAVMSPDEIAGLLVSVASGFGSSPKQALPPAA
jgi:two-component system chemotaxis response regulator CheB